METKTVFLFLVHFVVLYLVEFSASTVDSKNFKNKCPQVWNIIQGNKVENYTINCKYLDLNTTKVKEETVLQYACFLVENIVTYICDNRLSINSEQLTLSLDNKNSVCPFNFQRIRSLKNFTYHKMEEELIKNDHCNKVCNDIYEPKAQCVVLYKVNTFIGQIGVSETKHIDVIKEEKSHPVPENKHIINNDTKTEESVKTTSKLGFEAKGTKKCKTTQETSQVKTSTSLEKILSTKAETVSPAKELKSSSITPSMELNSSSPGYGKPGKFIFDTSNEMKPPVEDPFTQDFDGVDDLEEINRQSLNPEPVVHNQEFFEEKSVSRKQPIVHESSSRSQVYAGEGLFQAEDSHFFFYFLMFSSVIIIGYLAFHNKNKILAYALEGTSGRRSRRRPNPARYRKLESNLEEAMTSNVSQSSDSTVVY